MDKQANKEFLKYGHVVWQFQSNILFSAVKQGSKETELGTYLNHHMLASKLAVNR
jgi:hypothetical protein